MSGRRFEMGAMQRGYTLVELMAAMVITLFVMAGVYTLMLQNQRTYEQQSQLADAQQAARVAIDLMTREIRMAGADPSGRAFSPITTCLDADYKLPLSTTAPAPDTLAALTVANLTQIRVKMDRPVWGIGAETLSSGPPATPNPNPKRDCSTPADNDYDDDDEDWLGDGFINDEAEDVEYIWDSGTKVLSRNEYIAYPDASCVGCSTGVPAAGTYSIPIAEHIVDLQFKYYSTEPVSAPCPTGVYATQVEYEIERDICDPPLAAAPPDLSEVRRVRMVLVVETEKRDPINPAGGTNKLTLTSQATLRNRR